MALDVTIIEGHPIMTSASNDAGGSPKSTITGSNMSALCIIEMLNNFDKGRTGVPQWTGQSLVHNNTSLKTDTLLISNPAHLYQPVGYSAKLPTEILQDLVRYQAHVNHGIFRKIPTRDQDTGSWVRSTGSGTWFSHVDENTENGPDTRSLTTTVVDDELWLGFFGSLPSQLTTVKMIRINIHGLFEETQSPPPAGTNRGHSLRLKPYFNAVQGTKLLGTLIGPTIGQRVTMPLWDGGGTAEIEFMQSFYLGINEFSDGKFDDMELLIKAERIIVGSDPKPKWHLFTVDIDLFGDVSDVDLLDEASFDSIDSYFSGQTPSYNLDGDFVNITIDEAMLEVLAHATELFLYLSNDSKITCAKIPAYSTESSPYKIGPAHGNFNALQSTPVFDEKLVTSMKLDFNRKVTNVSSATASDDALLNIGITHFVFEERQFKRRIDESEADQTRGLITNGDVALRYIQISDDIYGTPIDVFIVPMNHHVLRVEIGQIVALDIPDLGLSVKKMLVVAVETDFDDVAGVVTLFDLEFIEPV